MQATPQNPLGHAPIGPLLVRFAVPSVIAMLVNSLYNIVDQIFIGHAVGYLGNAATNVAYPLTTIGLALALLLAQGCASMQNLKLGAGERTAAERAVGNTVVLLTLFGVLLFSFGQLFLSDLLYLFGATEQTYTLARTYTGITLWGMPFAIFSTGLNSTIRADGSPVYAMVSMLCGCLCNVALDALFMLGFGWGIAGAAWATVIGQVLGFSVSFSYLFRYRNIKLSRAAFVLDIHTCLRIASLGLASFCNQLSVTVVQIVLNNTITHYGALSSYGADIPLAVVGIVSKISMVILSILIGIAQASQPIISFSYGAGLYARVKQAYLLSLRASTCIAVLGFLLLQFFPRPIIGLFGSGSDAYVELAVRFLRIYLCTICINAIQPTTALFFTSIGKATRGIFISLTRQILFFLPMIVLLPYLFGLEGVLFAAPIADLVSAAVSILLVRRAFRAIDATATERTMEA